MPYRQHQLIHSKPMKYIGLPRHSYPLAVSIRAGILTYFKFFKKINSHLINLACVTSIEKCSEFGIGSTVKMASSLQ